jgi:hypothetical protein
MAPRVQVPTLAGFRADTLGGVCTLHSPYETARFHRTYRRPLA